MGDLVRAKLLPRWCLRNKTRSFRVNESKADGPGDIHQDLPCTTHRLAQIPSFQLARGSLGRQTLRVAGHGAWNERS